MKSVFFRADANFNIGFGHVSRLNTIATHIQDKYKPVFIQRTDSKIFGPLAAAGFEIVYFDAGVSRFEEPGLLIDKLNLHEGDTFVMDGYEFDANYEDELNASGARTIRIFDLFDRPMHSKVLVNHGINEIPAGFDLLPGQSILYGLDYLMINPKFFEVDELKPKTKENHILIAFGGADPLDLTGIYADFLTNELNQSVRIIVPADKRSYYQRSFPTAEVLSNLSVQEMIKEMDASSHAILPSSTVAFEALARGLKVAIGYFVENQKNIYQFLLTQNLAHGLGDFRAFDDSMKKSMRDFIAATQIAKISRRTIENPKSNFQNLFCE